MKKGLSLGLDFMKTYLFWQMFLKGRFMFMLSTVWSLLWGVKSMLTSPWLRIGFLPKFCVPSSLFTHPFTFFLLVVADFSFCGSQCIFHFHLLVLTKITSFRNQGAPSFKTWREFKKMLSSAYTVLRLFLLNIGTWSLRFDSKNFKYNRTETFWVCLLLSLGYRLVGSSKLLLIFWWKVFSPLHFLLFPFLVPAICLLSPTVDNQIIVSCYHFLYLILQDLLQKIPKSFSQRALLCILTTFQRQISLMLQINCFNSKQRQTFLVFLFQ